MFRALVTIQTQLGDSFAGVTSQNEIIDIILLFVTLICIILIVKRNLIGALIYLVGYGAYLGKDIIDNIIKIVNNTGDLELGSVMTAFTGVICILLAIALVLDVLFDQIQKAHPRDRKTDWFFKNEQFDRKYDERADKNHYKNL
jgi:hypothetical protein